MLSLSERHNNFIKCISSVVVFVFTFSIVSQEPALAFSSPRPNVLVNSVSDFNYNLRYSLSEFSLPAYMGAIEKSSVSEATILNKEKEPSNFLDKVFNKIENNDSISDSLVIHIQDAHCNYDAQMRIAEILTHINEKYNIKNINLEGGTGDYDLSIYRKIDDIESRKRIAELFVRDGELSGAEYFAALNPENIVLNGVEDKELYKENLRAYREIVKEKVQRSRVLNVLVEHANILKSYIYK